MSCDGDALAKFAGVARLFPLPNLVLFPHVVQPLHIFEPRYRQLTADALAGDRLIAISLLQPGWDQDYDGRPALHPTACLGQIVAEEKLADGRYNLLLRGLARIQIKGELDDGGRLYRRAEVEVCADQNPFKPKEATAWRRRLKNRVLPQFANNAETKKQLQSLFHSDLTLPVLCDVLSFALPLPLDCKQELLDERCLHARARKLLAALPRPVKVEEVAARKFPPEFSTN